MPLLRSGVLRNTRLVVKDPSKVLLSSDALDKLQTRQVRLETEEPPGPCASPSTRVRLRLEVR